jgi:hypothetical protein
MRNKTLPLNELSIDQLYSGDKVIYEVPIYQRNFAWEKDEISTLVQDIYDAFTASKPTYYIGTLVSFHKGDSVYEIIDGQQRLTTIYLILNALNVPIQNKLTYRARKKSSDTICGIPKFEVDEKDMGIVNGFRYVKESIDEIVVSKGKRDGFSKYFLYNVHLIHYRVPKDIDLNHYFEVMNSRGEQLEKHEIIKARLIEKLRGEDRDKFNLLWEHCSEMNVYIQQRYQDAKIFGEASDRFKIKSFDELPKVAPHSGTLSIRALIDARGDEDLQEDGDKIDTFRPITDFSNFLLIVLKLTRIEEEEFDPTSFNLDDKELINEFDDVKRLDAAFVKRFGYNLLLAKYLLDNYLVHHSNEEDTIKNNPWLLQHWQTEYTQDKQGKKRKHSYPKNLGGDRDSRHKLVQLLSMFEVSFTARQRKNYLFYCLLYLFCNGRRDIDRYSAFVSDLADKYFRDVYLVADNLNEINTPKPGSFDNSVLNHNRLDVAIYNENPNFADIYGDGAKKSKGIPLFIFNYLDYKLWERYFDTLRGQKTKETDRSRKNFFRAFGCRDFGLKPFEQFYFSRTRRSLEHYFPQARADGKNGRPTQEQINCFGNYAMIGSEANSSGSDRSPKVKPDHYLDAFGKINQVSVASIKFMIMMQICKDNQSTRESGEEWIFADIAAHQAKMLEVLGS